MAGCVVPPWEKSLPLGASRALILAAASRARWRSSDSAAASDPAHRHARAIAQTDRTGRVRGGALGPRRPGTADRRSTDARATIQPRFRKIDKNRCADALTWLGPLLGRLGTPTGEVSRLSTATECSPNARNANKYSRAGVPCGRRRVVHAILARNRSLQQRADGGALEARLARV